MVSIKKLQIADKANKLLDISFDIKHSVALVGESGSGKSLTLKALLGVLPKTLECFFDYTSTFPLNTDNVAFVPQNPFTAFSPLTKITNQFFLSLEEQIHFMNVVGLEKDLLYKFPSQLSGGQLQRVLFAIAISKNPKLILLDEPTTALDEANKTNILQLIKTIQDDLKSLILFVTHDITSIQNLCKNIVVIQKGFIQEAGETNAVLTNPKSDYTQSLIKCNFKNRGFRN